MHWNRNIIFIKFSSLSTSCQNNNLRTARENFIKIMFSLHFIAFVSNHSLFAASWHVDVLIVTCGSLDKNGHPFYPRPVLAFGYCHRLRLCVCVSVCVCVSLCVNHLLVRAITRDPFKLGSPNLDQRCKRPWLRSLLFLGVIDLDLQGQI